MRGRKRTPLESKRVIGTIRPDRLNPGAPVPEPELPRAPDWLPKRACEIFGVLTTRLDLQRIASKSHTEMLAMAALRLCEVEQYTEVLETEGVTYEAETKVGGIMLRARPEAALRSEALRHAHALLAEFGLSPATVSKVTVRKDDNRSAAQKYFTA